MGNPKLVFITGPSGAGKSTTAEEVAARWPALCAAVNFDAVRALVRSGYAEPALGWDQETERQWQLARHVVIAMARAYLDNGVSVVLEAFATPGDFPEWQRLFGDLPRTAVALLPDVAVVLARNGRREGATRLTESDVARNHEWSAGWTDVPGVTVIDNGAKDVAEVAEEILELSAG